MKKRNKAVPAVYLFLELDGKWLFARRQNTGYQDGNWNVPSGHVEEGELPIQAMIREAKEEIGITLLDQDMKLVHVSFRPRHDETGSRADYFFTARVWFDDIENIEPDKCAKLEWFRPEMLPLNITPHVRHAFECFMRQRDSIRAKLEWFSAEMLPSDIAPHVWRAFECFMRQQQDGISYSELDKAFLKKHDVWMLD